MGLARLSVILVALLGPDWLPPAPDVQFTQVDQQGNELGDSYPATCGMGICRASFPVEFGNRHCLFNAWVELPKPGGTGLTVVAQGPCQPGFTRFNPPATDISEAFRVDAHGAATKVLEVAGTGGLRLLSDRAADATFIRFDVILSTTDHR